MNFHVWTFFQCHAKYLCVREKFSFVYLKLIFGSDLRRKALDACDKNGLSWKWYRFRWKLLHIWHWSPLSCQEIQVHSVYTLILPEIYITCESFDLQIIFHSFPRINTNNRLAPSLSLSSMNNKWWMYTQKLSRNKIDLIFPSFIRNCCVPQISIIDVMRGFLKINFLRNAHWSTWYCQYFR